jgi:hypothetical protein
MIARVLSAPVRAFVWTLDLCDAKGSPSLSKGIAFGVAAIALRDAWLHTFGQFNLIALTLATSAAFGRSVFMNWLNRNQSTTTTAVTVDAAATLKALPNLWHDDESGNG